MTEESTSTTLTEATLDLAEIARIQRGDRVEVENIRDATQDLFDKTLALVQPAGGADRRATEPGEAQTERKFVPENKDLRAIYFLAERVMRVA